MLNTSNILRRLVSLPSYVNLNKYATASVRGFKFSSSKNPNNTEFESNDNNESTKEENVKQDHIVFEKTEIRIGKNQNLRTSSSNSGFTNSNDIQEEGEGEEKMSSMYKLALLSVCGAAAFILYKLNEMQSKLKKLDDVRVSHRGAAEVGKSWQLIGTDGNPITEKSFQGNYYLVYFGFCHCPDICPSNLIKIRKALSLISKKTNMDIRLLFVSVDPERDTLKDIDNFVSAYDTSIIGATATDQEQLKETLKSFKVVANKVFYEPDDDERKTLQAKYGDDTSKIYTMDHTTNTYLMGRNGEFLTFFDGNRQEDQLADGILAAIQADQSNSTGILTQRS